MRRPCPPAAGASSASVPNEPQPGHFPNQRPAEYPHSAHAYTTAAFAISGLGDPVGIGARWAKPSLPRREPIHAPYSGRR